jgi:uncharacterized protein (DUF2062 family)
MRRYLERLQTWIKLLLRENLTPGGIGLAVALGIFIGSLPIYGLHIVACVLVARWLRLNQALVYGAANISNPFFAPFLISGQILLGEWIRHGGQVPASTPTMEEEPIWRMLDHAPNMFVSCFLGALVSGTILAVVCGFLATWIARRWRPPTEAQA